MRAILIEPDHDTKTVRATEVVVNVKPTGRADRRHIYSLLGCRLVQQIEPDDDSPLAGHVALVDEEGGFRPLPGYMLLPALYPLPIFRSVLVLGYDGEEEEWVPATASLDLIQTMLPNAYCAPKRAHELMVAAEKRAKALLPGVIVLEASSLINPHM